MTDEIPADTRSNDEIVAAAKADYDRHMADKRDNPTDDEDENAFLRAMRTALADAKPDTSVKDAFVFDSPALGEIWMKFEDAHSKVLTIATVKIEGEDVPLSIAGKAALLDIVRDVKADQAAANRLTAKATTLQALARKATGEKK
jgi:hypothetical protein